MRSGIALSGIKCSLFAARPFFCAARERRKRLSPLSVCKMNGDRTDLCLRPHAHIRAEHPDTGGDDVVHLLLLKIPAGVFPHQPDGEIAGEHLTVVRVAAEICIDVPHLRQKKRDDDGTGQERLCSHRQRPVAHREKTGTKLHPTHHAAR